MGHMERLSQYELAMMTLRQLDGAKLSEAELHGLICRLTTIAADCLQAFSKVNATVESLQMAAGAIDPKDSSDPSDLAYAVECLDTSVVESEREADAADARDEAAAIADTADMVASAKVESMRFSHHREHA